MDQFYRKWIRIFWAILVGNAFIALLQLGFAYGHYLKHEYWMMLLSLFFFCFNGGFAVNQYRHIRRIYQERKDYMWKTLSTPSEVLR